MKRLLLTAASLAALGTAAYAQDADSAAETPTAEDAQAFIADAEARME